MIFFFWDFTYRDSHIKLINTAGTVPVSFRGAFGDFGSDRRQRRANEDLRLAKTRRRFPNFMWGLFRPRQE